MNASQTCRIHNLMAAHRAFPTTFRGISPTRNGTRWTARIVDTRIPLPKGFAHIGTFDTPSTAARAYDLALIALGNPPFNFNLQHYRDTFPEKALRESLRAVRLRLGLTT